MNYTAWFALGEFVDNSITSYVKHIRDNPDDERFNALHVEIKWDEALNVLTISDNAAGIPDSEAGWKRALELGARNPDPTVLGVYGYGMKAAAFWYAPRVNIASKVAGEKVVRSISMDIDKIQSDNLEFIELTETPSPDLDHHGTVIRLHGLNPGRSYPRGMTLGKVRSYLASMYRAYLRGDIDFAHPRTGEPFLRISVQMQDLVAPSPELLNEPFWPRPIAPTENLEPIYWKKEIQFEVPNLRTPGKKQKPFKIKGWAGVLKTMSSDSGLYLMFHGKGLVGVGQGAGQAAQDTYKPQKLFGPSNGWRSRRLVAELDVSDFNKLNTSDGIKFSDVEKEMFEDALEQEMHRTLVYEMANNYRINSKDDMSKTQLEMLQSVVDHTANSAVAINGVIETDPRPQQKVDSTPPIGSERVAAEKSVFTSNGKQVRFSTVFGSAEDAWLSVYEIDDALNLIEVNMNHPFVQKYFTIPRNDPSGLFEVAIGMGLAEIERPELYPMRVRLNERLDAHHKLDLIGDSEDGFSDDF